MSDMQKPPAGKAANAKSPTNWPILIASGLCVAFIIGVWVNNYRVSHATPIPAPITSTK
jgi:hypothetical protein